jgi:hypothetical protein
MQQSRRRQGTMVRMARSSDRSDRAARPGKDRFALYEAAVQVPEHEVSFFERAFKDAHHREPRVLREDFCGTAAVARAWVASAEDRTAFAIDHDPAPLAYGRAQAEKTLDDDARARLTWIESDVRLAVTPAADVAAVQNFSINELGDRRVLVAYLADVRANLAAEGVLVLDVMGGPARQVDARTETRRFRGFEMEWTQRRYDPIAGRGQFALSFVLDDGARIDDAFTYDWRLWTIPELRDALADAGFGESVVYWAGDDTKRGGHQGVYKRRREAPADASYVAYVVGIRR